MVLRPSGDPVVICREMAHRRTTDPWEVQDAYAIALRVWTVLSVLSLLIGFSWLIVAAETIGGSASVTKYVFAAFLGLVSLELALVIVAYIRASNVLKRIVSEPDRFTINTKEGKYDFFVALLVAAVMMALFL